jgi:hypothetical protein
MSSIFFPAEQISSLRNLPLCVPNSSKSGSKSYLPEELRNFQTARWDHCDGPMFPICNYL